jgi:mannose/fructose/N-acetylgalactosamine-specific phosphotransferase system component IIC
MTPELFLLVATAALLELDTTYALQLTFSRGIIAGPLLGLLTGDLMAGLQVGIFTELIFSDVSPLGGILPPSAVVCCAVTLALKALGIELYFAFFFGVLTAILFSIAEKFMRKNRFKWLVYWEHQIMQNPNAINRTILFSLGSSFLINFILIFLFVLICGKLMIFLVPLIPMKAHFACQFAYMAVPWIGLATLIPTFGLKFK